MSELLVNHMAIEVSESQRLEQVISFNVDAQKALQLVSQLQLALRYPANNGGSAVLGRQMVAVIKEWFHVRGHLACVTVIERGDDPQFDMRMDFNAAQVRERINGLRESVNVLPALPEDPRLELKDPDTFREVEHAVLLARGDLLDAFNRYLRAIDTLVELEARL